MLHVDAELLFHQRIEYDEGAIVEMVLWRVPSPVPPSTHGLKYSLFYGRSGVREVGYTFSSVEQLMVDFWSDVRAVRGRT